MNKNLSLSIRVSTYIFVFIIYSCNNKASEENWTKFMNLGKECSEKKFAFLADCQSKEAEAWQEFQKCQSFCKISPVACAQKTGLDWQRCFADQISMVNICQSRCFEIYHKKIQEIETCKNNWDVAFWDCMNSQGK